MKTFTATGQFNVAKLFWVKVGSIVAYFTLADCTHKGDVQLTGTMTVPDAAYAGVVPYRVDSDDDWTKRGVVAQSTGFPEGAFAVIEFRAFEFTAAVYSVGGEFDITKEGE